MIANDNIIPRQWEPAQLILDFPLTGLPVLHLWSMDNFSAATKTGVITLCGFVTANAKGLGVRLSQ